MNCFNARTGLAAFCALVLAGCIDSKGPILTDSQPVFGERLRLQLYSLYKGAASEPEQVTYRWNGEMYARAGGGLRDVRAFSVHEFENGDYIVQDVPSKRPRYNEYGLMHKLADGVYLIRAIDEDDADEATRKAHCGKGEPKDPASCRITTREQLFAFARAAAAKHHGDGGLVIRLDVPEKAERRTKGPPRR